MTDLYPPTNLVAWIDLSTYCNAACPQCHRVNPNGLNKVDWLPLVQWTIDEFKKMFPKDVLARYSWFEFCGTWGDPLMNKDIYAIVSYILSNTHSTQIQINTNGSLRDPDWWWNLGLLSKRRLHVWFDIDGVDQAMHSRYRQKTDFKKIQDNIESYTATGASAHAMTIVFMHNEDYLDDIEKLVRAWGIRGQHITVPSNRFYDNKIVDLFVKEDGTEDILMKSTL